MDLVEKKKQYTLKKYFAILITIIVLAVSLTYFPWFGSGFGWGGIGRESFIITCVFVSVWLGVLVLAAIFKSKVLINAYLIYWLVVLSVCVFFLFTGPTIASQGLEPILFLWFFTPIIGISYQLPNLPIMIIPICMVLLGFIIKIIFTRKSSAKQSIE